ncbi:MAG: polyisoprenoid-binding protein [Methylococcaceae bacterium]|nr:polyisoprenoid-binding protein [Methylococcaceae bacterium]
MKKSVLALMIMSSLSLPAVASDNYTVDSRHTFPSFEINHLGFSIQRGRFNKTTGNITLDPRASTGSIQISIDAASISTGLTDLEDHLRGKDFLDVAQFPQITFISNQLIFNNDRLVSVNGDLTLHGITKPVQLTVDHFHCGMNLIAMKNTCGANATTTIKRTDFGVSKYVPAVADDVNIAIQIEATKN